MNDDQTKGNLDKIKGNLKENSANFQIMNPWKLKENLIRLKAPFAKNMVRQKKNWQEN